MLALAGCGPTGPSPEPSPSGPRPGGLVDGPYVLRIQPASGCAIPHGPLSFSMAATPGGTSPHPGVQVVLSNDPPSLELEFKYTESTLRGGLGTTGDGVLSNEGLRLWMHSIGTGNVTQTSDGHGEVMAGKLMGYLALGGAADEEGALGTCSALDHTFTLRVP